jgi:tetratricopeptide (TPR) repeat protein
MSVSLAPLIAGMMFWVSASMCATPDPSCAAYDADDVIARQFLTKGLYAEAAQILARLVQDLTSNQREDCDLAQALNNLALSYQKLGRYREAEPLFLKSAKRLQANNDPTYDVVLANLAVLYTDFGQVSKAKEIARRLKLAAIPSGPERVHIFNVLGTIAASSRDYVQAEQLFREALIERSAAGGIEDLELAILLNNHAKVRLEFDRSPEVEECLKKAVRIIEQKGGSLHPLLISALMNLADFQRRCDRSADAVVLTARALEISRNTFGPDHMKTGEILGDYSAILKVAGRKSEAREAERCAKLIAKRHSHDNLEGHTVELQDLQPVRRRRSP